MRYWELCETSRHKFWADPRGNIIWLPDDRAHHAVAAFDLPAAASAIVAALDSEEAYEALEDRTREAFREFKADGSRSDEAYLAEHDRVLAILFAAGWTRGNRGGPFNLGLEFTVRGERGARKAAALLKPDYILIDRPDLDDAISVRADRVATWLKGRPSKEFI